MTDGPPALALGLEPPEPGVMKKLPRNSRDSVFAGGVGLSILFQGAVIGLVSLASYWIALTMEKTLAEAHTMAFLTMALAQLVHSFNVRSFDRSLFKLGLSTNRSLVGAFVLSVVLQLVIVFIPFLRGIFGTALPSAGDWGIILGLSLVPLVVVEISKAWKRKKAGQLVI